MAGSKKAESPSPHKYIKDAFAHTEVLQKISGQKTKNKTKQNQKKENHKGYRTRPVPWGRNCEGVKVSAHSETPQRSGQWAPHNLRGEMQQWWKTKMQKIVHRDQS